MIRLQFEGETIKEAVDNMLDFIHNNVSDASYFERFTNNVKGELARDEDAKVDKEAAKTPEPALVVDDTPESIDITEVRKRFSAWARKNGTDKAKEILAKFDAQKLQDVSEDSWGDLLEALV